MNGQEECSVLDATKIEAACAGRHIKSTTEGFFVGEYRSFDCI